MSASHDVETTFPETLTLNAWCGEAVVGAVAAGARGWGVRRQRPTPTRLLAAADPADLRDWQHASVGWGLVLADDDALSTKARATADDAPEPIRELVRARGDAPVFRYRKDLPGTTIRRYFPDGAVRDLALSGSRRGIGDQKLPRYLLIYGQPSQIPWSFQYVLGQSSFVGRLDIDGEGLEHYVAALLEDFGSAGCRSDRPVVWSVDHGAPDITWLMHHAIGAQVAKRLSEDTDIAGELRYLSGSAATVAGLLAALEQRAPALVVTTSHGMTGPLDDPARMRETLGLPVDDARRLLDPRELLARWQPDGAVWYAHACCSAGGDSATSYAGLLAEGSTADRVLEAVAALGAACAPLPRVLLGARKPLRAFIGQVEPTFDWTLRAQTGQVLTDSLCQALYERMHRKRPEPVGMAFAAVQRHAGDLFAQLDLLKRQIAAAVDGADRQAVRTHLAALDRQSLVVLGDPTVALPPLIPVEPV